MEICNNDKLILFLAVLAIASLSPFHNARIAASSDFASESGSSIADCIEQARSGSPDDCQISQKTDHKRTDTVVLKNLHIVTDAKNHEQLEGTAVAVVECSECKIEESSSIDLRAIPINDIAKIDQQLKQADKDAAKQFSKAKSDKDKELGCEVDDDGNTIEATNTDAKMSCFKDKMAGMDDAQKKKYVSTYVEPYFKSNVEQGISQQALNGNPYAAHNMAAQWRALGLGDSINGKLNLIDTVAQTRVESLQYNASNNAIAMQFMSGLMSTDPKVRAAALKAYNGALNMNAQNHFVRLMNDQSALNNSMTGLSSTDPMMASLSSGMMMQLNQNVQGMINSNKALSSTLGPNFAANSLGGSWLTNSMPMNGNLMNNSLFLGGTNNTSSLFNSDPLSTNSNLGLSSMMNLGLNTNGSDNWQQFPQWGSNVATGSGTNASFSNSGSIVAPTTSSNPANVSVPRTARMSTPSTLKRIN